MSPILILYMSIPSFILLFVLLCLRFFYCRREPLFIRTRRILNERRNNALTNSMRLRNMYSSSIELDNNQYDISHQLQRNHVPPPYSSETNQTNMIYIINSTINLSESNYLRNEPPPTYSLNA